MAQTKQLPNHADLEERVLGCLMQYPKAIDQVPLDLRPEDFYQIRHQQIYTVMRGLSGDGKPITAPAIKAALEDETVTGLMAMQGNACIPGEMPYYVDKIKAAAVKRRVVEFCNHSALRALDRDLSTEDLLATVEKSWVELTQVDAPASWLDQKALLLDHMDLLQKRAERGGMIGIPSGFPELDYLTGGWQPGHLIFLAAVPKMGKTAIGLHFALHSGVPVLFFTLEMLAHELADRQISARGKVDGQLIKLGRLNDQDYTAITDAFADLCQLPIGWVEKTGLSVAEIRSICRRFAARYGLGLVVIDQLDKIIEPQKTRENKTDAIGRTTRALKNLAHDLRVPVVCLVQLLDKQTAKRKTPRPSIGDVRDSSYPDQDCDVMLYLWRPEFYWPKKYSLAGMAEVIISRQRSGPPGSIWARWRPRYTSFEELPVESWPTEEDLK